MTVAQGMRRWLKPLIGIGITGLFLYLILADLDTDQVIQAFSNVPVWAVLLAIASLAVGYNLRVVRWWWMLRGLEPDLRASDCAWPLLVSVSVNNVLPFRAGDALRVVGFREQLRSPAMRVLGTLVIERLLDLMALMTFFFAGLLYVPDGVFSALFIETAVWISAITVVLLIVLLFFSQALRRGLHALVSALNLQGNGIVDAVLSQLDHVFEILASLSSKALVARMMLISLLVWLFEGGVFLVVALALTSELPTIAPLFALATGTLATLLPSSPGYFGTFDYFAMQGVIAFGMAAPLATAFALTVHFILWLPLTVAGFSYYLSPSFRRQREALDKTQAEKAPHD